MLETWTLGRHLAWGYHKHPPMMGWITRGWTAVFPLTDWSLQLMAMVNAAVALWAVDLISRRFVRGEKRVIVLLLAMLLPVLMMVIMVAVAGGRVAIAQGSLQQAASDAARAASIARDAGEAASAAGSAAEASLAGQQTGCHTVAVTTNRFRSVSSWTRTTTVSPGSATSHRPDV